MPKSMILPQTEHLMTWRDRVRHLPESPREYHVSRVARGRDSAEKFVCDYTKSTNATRSSTVVHLETLVQNLRRKVFDLQLEVSELKAGQLLLSPEMEDYNKEISALQKQIVTLRSQLRNSEVQRDFLQRFNRSIKAECEKLTEGIIQLRGIRSARSAHSKLYEPKSNKIITSLNVQAAGEDKLWSPSQAQWEAKKASRNQIIAVGQPRQTGAKATPPQSQRQILDPKESDSEYFCQAVLEPWPRPKIRLFL